MLRKACAGLGLMLALAGGSAEPAQAAGSVPLLYIAQRQEPKASLSAIDRPPEDEGLPGFRLAARDNETGTRFLPPDRQTRFPLREAVVEPGGDFLAEAAAALEGPESFVVVDASAENLLKLADLPAARGKLLFNAGAGETSLRDAQCRGNVLHTLPSHAQLADGLMQFLARKRWARLFLVPGPAPQDQLIAEAYRNAAKKFGLKVVQERPWTGESDLRRTAQGDASGFTQVGEYDVLVVADDNDDFGDALIGNTFLPRPVAGTQGLTPVAWDRVFEQWGATQLQNRFEALAGRPMRSKDWAAWAAVRAVGEGALKLRTDDPAAIAAYVRSDRLRLDGFKGRSLSFRPWSGELRQPVQIIQPRAVISTSPQEGVLHPVTDLDTLGIDRAESKCPLKDAAP
jgi:ABC transporter substrate binding protein (PQQ-dependent alcohol dehydrogenase system)